VIAEKRTLRIGVYNNPPKIELCKSGKPCGLFIDIIEYIAKSEGWELEYIYGTWETGLSKLENGNIDLMPDVAVSEVRSQRFDFNKITILSSWLQVYTRNEIEIKSIAALEGKTVAVLEGSIQQQVCNNIRNQLGLSFKMIALPDYNSCIKNVVTGNADAVIVGRFYGYNNVNSLTPTAIILHPTTLNFATLNGHNQDLLEAIDKHVARMMNDPRSVYYRSIDYWLSEKPRVFIPVYIKWSVVLIGFALLFFLVLSLILRWQVRKKTNELQEKNNALLIALQQLKVVQDEALKNERLCALGQLASGVAHDFNNLLVPIMGCADMMLNSPEELDNRENAIQNLSTIVTAAQHGTEIIGRLQQFYCSSKHSEINDIIDTSEIIREIVELTKTRMSKVIAGGKAVDVILNLGDNYQIKGRRSDIHEMLLNLVLNAADAMPEGGRLEISIEKSDDEVTFIVKDSGLGMTEEIQEKCLQPFFTTKGKKGTGMGLTMVNNIVTEHNGRIEIVSSIGCGTCFKITFPCTQCQFLT
jgi:signal transduction histidine kinase